MLTGKELGDAIRTAIAIKGTTQAALARHFGVKSPSVAGWLADGRIDKAKLIEMFDYFSDVVGPEHWGLPAQSNLTGKLWRIKAFDDNEPLAEDEVEVARKTLKLSAGGGRMQWEIDEKGTPNRYRKSWCTRRGFDPEMLVTVVVDGDSMNPTLVDGGQVVINTADTRIKTGMPFAIDYQGEFYVKRLFVEPDGSIRVSSDNMDKMRYPDWTVTAAHGDSLRIMGRVVQTQNDL